MALERMVWYLLHQQMRENPLPWRVERDWTYEVTASNGAVIAKCQTHEEAEEIIRMAEEIRERDYGGWAVSEATESARDRLALSYDQRCNHPLGHSENLSIFCKRPKGHQGPHKGI